MFMTIGDVWWHAKEMQIFTRVSLVKHGNQINHSFFLDVEISRETLKQKIMDIDSKKEMEARVVDGKLYIGKFFYS